MSFDPLDPFANGPFILPVNNPGEVSGLNIPSSYESRIAYNGTPLSTTYGFIRIEVDPTADRNASISSLNSSGDLVFKSITKDPTTGNDVVVTITNPADILGLITWITSGNGAQTFANLITGTDQTRALNAIFTPELRDEANAHTIQRLLEVNYIREANRILSNSLFSLNNALDGTNNILNTLSNIQSLHNRVTVKTPSGLDFDYTVSHDGTSSGYSSAYQTAASAYFGPPIFPDFLWSSVGAIVTGMPGGGTFGAYAQELQASKVQLGLYLSALLPQTPTLPGGAVDPNSLYARAKTVYDNLPGTSAAPPTFSAARAWALDSYNQSDLSGASQAGELQQQITFAITAGQSLNDTLKEKVRRYLFVFEEYYKSASAMLTKISDLITKFAQGIRPS